MNRINGYIGNSNSSALNFLTSIVRSDLFFHRVVFGSSSKNWNSENKDWTLGFYKGQSILDFNKVTFSLRRSLYFIYLVFLYTKKPNIIFVSNFSYLIRYHKEKLKVLKKYIKRELRMLYLKKWDNGLLTNMYIRNNYKYKLGKKPDLVFILGNLRNCLTILKECVSEKIPTMGIVDANSSMNLVQYPIFANDENLISIFYILKLISLTIDSAKIDKKKQVFRFFVKKKNAKYFFKKQKNFKKQI